MTSSQGNLCPVCGVYLPARRWHVLDMPSLGVATSRIEDAGPPPTVSEMVIDTCSEVCGRLLSGWLSERKKWADKARYG